DLAANVLLVMMKQVSCAAAACDHRHARIHGGQSQKTHHHPLEGTTYVSFICIYVSKCPPLQHHKLRLVQQADVHIHTAVRSDMKSPCQLLLKCAASIPELRMATNSGHTKHIYALMPAKLPSIWASSTNSWEASRTPCATLQ
ncbi:hypothetical protein COO60DRAFT_1516658, partial [Scenedesmus sp. NREL 46B-D3]